MLAPDDCLSPRAAAHSSSPQLVIFPRALRRQRVVGSHLPSTHAVLDHDPIGIGNSIRPNLEGCSTPSLSGRARTDVLALDASSSWFAPQLGADLQSETSDGLSFSERSQRFWAQFSYCLRQSEVGITSTKCRPAPQATRCTRRVTCIDPDVVRGIWVSPCRRCRWKRQYRQFP